PALPALPRRHPRERQASMIERLTDAAIEELRKTGFESLTVRNVARRAGVAAATAYTYFASKNHLVSEVFWRKLHALPSPQVDNRRGPAARVSAALRDVTAL